MVPSELTQYLKLIAKTCHGNCIDGWIHVAWQETEDGTWEVFRFPCRCTYPSGLDLGQVTQEHRYKRKPDYVAPRAGRMFIHPRNNPTLFANIKQALARLRHHLDMAEQMEVPF